MCRLSFIKNIKTYTSFHLHFYPRKGVYFECRYGIHYIMNHSYTLSNTPQSYIFLRICFKLKLNSNNKNLIIKFKQIINSTDIVINAIIQDKKETICLVLKQVINNLNRWHNNVQQQ